MILIIFLLNLNIITNTAFAKNFTFFRDSDNPRVGDSHSGDCGGLLIELKLKGNKFVSGQGIELEGDCDKKQVDLAYLNHNEKTGSIELVYVDGGGGSYKKCVGTYYYQKKGLDFICRPAKLVGEVYEYDGTFQQKESLVINSIK